MKRRDWEHLFDNRDKMYKFCKNNDIPYPNYKILEVKLNSNEAKQKEEYWLNFYKNNNWEMFNSRKTGSLGAITPKWTKIALQREVNKYKTRGEFQKNSTAYCSAVSHNLINELFKNHPNQGYTTSRNIRNYWTKDKLQEEANKFKTRNEFHEKSKAYSIAQNKQIIDELFKNHPNQGYILKRKTVN